MLGVVAHFAATGQRSPDVEWEIEWDDFGEEGPDELDNQARGAETVFAGGNEEGLRGVRTKFSENDSARNPLGGLVVETPNEMVGLLHGVRGRPPFVAELSSDGDFKLVLGVGAQACFVQFSSKDGEPPYLLAVQREAWGSEDLDEEVTFFLGDENVPVGRSVCVPFETMVKIVAHFVATGGRYPGVEWEVL